MPEEKPAGNLTRRAVIATAAFVPLSAIRSAAQTPALQRVFSAEQKRTLEAFLDRLRPKDGAQDYIEAQLGYYLAPEKQTFLDGLAALDALARQSQGSPLADLSPEKRDQVLTDIDSGNASRNAHIFFNRARRLMLEGMFGDPHYGGNKNFTGWDLMGYPGPRLATGSELQRMGAPIAPYHRSAWGNEHGGH